MLLGCQSAITVHEHIPKHAECWEEYQTEDLEACERREEARLQVEVLESMRTSWQIQENMHNGRAHCAQIPEFTRSAHCSISLVPSRAPKAPFHLKGEWSRANSGTAQP